MQKPDPKKRGDILKVAEPLFATKPFHEVKLDDIAARAKIGKGTIYIYFKSKEDVYVSLIRDGMTGLPERLRALCAQKARTSDEELRLVVAELVNFAAARPNMFQLLRSVLPKPCEGQLAASRRELVSVIEDVIRRGIRRHEMHDPNPRLTAEFILSSLRGAMLFGPEKLTSRQLIEHMLYVYSTAVQRKER
jgi:AcrR family transcriptional regulator